MDRCGLPGVVAFTPAQRSDAGFIAEEKAREVIAQQEESPDDRFRLEVMLNDLAGYLGVSMELNSCMKISKYCSKVLSFLHETGLRIPPNQRMEKNRPGIKVPIASGVDQRVPFAKELSEMDGYRNDDPAVIRVTERFQRVIKSEIDKVQEEMAEPPMTLIEAPGACSYTPPFRGCPHAGWLVGQVLPALISRGYGELAAGRINKEHGFENPPSVEVQRAADREVIQRAISIADMTIEMLGEEEKTWLAGDGQTMAPRKEQEPGKARSAGGVS
ncbi:hypothetical protein COB72_09370 [bacterium]|nr:MAG: hypothetical protein COB72_09370 [bacterium]